MVYHVNAYLDIDEKDILESDTFDDYDEAEAFAWEKAHNVKDELDGDEIDFGGGAPDFLAELAIKGTSGVVIIKELRF